MALSILQRIASGDSTAMDDCLNQYGGLVWKIVTPRCKNRADAEDIVQEVFLALWKSAGRFDPDVAAESTFIAMVARRRVIDQHRRQQRSLKTTIFAEGSEPEAAQSKNRVEISDEASRARGMLNELKTEERSVIELAVDEGLSQSQIAERTQIPLGTVKTHARRGLIRLRKLLMGETAELEGGAR